RVHLRTGADRVLARVSVARDPLVGVAEPTDRRLRRGEPGALAVRIRVGVRSGVAARADIQDEALLTGGAVTAHGGCLLLPQQHDLGGNLLSLSCNRCRLSSQVAL